MLSYLIYGDKSASVTGLSEFPKENWPPVASVFQTYHVMVMIGMWFILVTAVSTVFLIKKAFYERKWILQLWVIMVPLPVIANELGWVSAEIGRQPWLVYGLMKTQEGISKSVSANEILVSLILFFIIYSLLFIVWIYIIDKEIKHGPDHKDLKPEVGYSAEEAKLGFFSKNQE
jgi:cytochrome d ubiquinol oxidase subunit I